jgi:ABC-type phosphate transport system ATPase subunit
MVRVMLLVTADSQQATRLEEEIRFFTNEQLADFSFS